MEYKCSEFLDKMESHFHIYNCNVKKHKKAKWKKEKSVPSIPLCNLINLFTYIHVTVAQLSHQIYLLLFRCATDQIAKANPRHCMSVIGLVDEIITRELCFQTNAQT